LTIGIQSSDAATPVVSAFYDRFPYPGDPLQDGPPPGYNWRWCHADVHSHCRGTAPAAHRPVRILDAGCGTGVSTDYLAHLNPGAEILAVDISAGALEVARERLRRSGAHAQAMVRLEQRSLLDLAGEGPFDHINSVGVLHHLDDPLAGLKALGPLLAPGGLFHLFLYADAGRWEIHRIQRALALLGAGTDGDGLRLGRSLLAELPADNRLRLRHEQRWAIDTTPDPNFADMYLHPQETSYDLKRLWRFVEAAGLEFLGFSNPEQWDPARLLQGELLERAQQLPQRERWLLIESLDPEISHLEFFVSNQPIQRQGWDNDAELLAARLQRSACLWGWPSAVLLNRDMAPLQLSADQMLLLQAVEPPEAEGLSLAQLPLEWSEQRRCAVARELHERGVLLLRQAG
jgi:SAM-dependent methyltransferase